MFLVSVLSSAIFSSGFSYSLTCFFFSYDNNFSNWCISGYEVRFITLCCRIPLSADFIWFIVKVQIFIMARSSQSVVVHRYVQARWKKLYYLEFKVNNILVVGKL